MKVRRFIRVYLLNNRSVPIGTEGVGWGVAEAARGEVWLRELEGAAHTLQGVGLPHSAVKTAWSEGTCRPA